MAGELRPVVEGDRLTQLGRQWSQDFGHGPGDGVCRLASHSQGNEEAGVPLVEDQNRLSIGSKQHQVSLPVASRLPVSSLLRTFRHRAPVNHPVNHEGRRTAPFASPPAPFRLGPGQVVAPRVILRPGQLAVDKPVDALVGDHLPSLLQSKASGNLLRRPALLQPGENPTAQPLISLQARPAPSALLGLLVRILRPVALAL